MRLRTVVLAGSAGVCATIAVAWGCALATKLLPSSHPRSFSSTEFGGAWIGPVPGGWPASPRVVMSGSSACMTMVRVDGSPSRPSGPPSQNIALFGLPFRSMRTEFNRDGARPCAWTWRQGLSTQDSQTVPGGRFWTALPLVPCWPGAFLDSAIFMAVALAWPTYKDLRCWSRRRRGRCARCGYHLGQGGQVCPECGTAIRDSSPVPV